LDHGSAINTMMDETVRHVNVVGRGWVKGYYPNMTQFTRKTSTAAGAGFQVLKSSGVISFLPPSQPVVTNIAIANIPNALIRKHGPVMSVSAKGRIKNNAGHSPFGERMPESQKFSLVLRAQELCDVAMWISSEYEPPHGVRLWAMRMKGGRDWANLQNEAN
jgi:hypothetical protein